MDGLAKWDGAYPGKSVLRTCESYICHRWIVDFWEKQSDSRKISHSYFSLFDVQCQRWYFQRVFAHQIALWVSEISFDTSFQNTTLENGPEYDVDDQMEEVATGETKCKSRIYGAILNPNMGETLHERSIHNCVFNAFAVCQASPQLTTPQSYAKRVVISTLS